jgi:hypothetical protein
MSRRDDRNIPFPLVALIALVLLVLAPLALLWGAKFDPVRVLSLVGAFLVFFVAIPGWVYVDTDRIGRENPAYVALVFFVLPLVGHFLLGVVGFVGLPLVGLGAYLTFRNGVG